MDQSRVELHETNGFATVDLLAHWHLAEGVSIDAGVFNRTGRR